MSELRTAALRLADKGKPVFPCRGKEPMTPHGVLDATCDRAVILCWWTRAPDANVGLATGRPSYLFVVDVDPAHGGMGTLARLCAHGRGLATLEVSTGGGGTHLYFTLPPDVEVGNSNAAIRKRFGPGVDVRGTSGYVIAPPSRHPSGGRYRWGPGTIRPVPGWLVDLLTAPESAPPARPPSVLPAGDDRLLLARFNRILERVAHEPEGNRNQLLYWAACRLRDLQAEGAPRGWADLLVEAGVAAGQQEAKARATVASGLRGMAS